MLISSSCRPLLVLLTLVLIACQTSKNTAPTASLRNTRWVLRTLGSAAITTPANGQEIYLQFNASTDQVTGYAGCNRFFGRFEQPTATTIRLFELGSTKMYCPDRQHVETEYLNALRTATRPEITGDTLRLYAGPGGKPLAVFEAVYLR